MNILQKYLLFFIGISLLLLIGVLFTAPVNGAKSWYDLKIFAFQPAEFAKIFTILTIAISICKLQEREQNSINRPLKLIGCLLLGIVPTLLVIIQPDFGTAMSFIVATALILFISGIDKRYIIGAFLILIILSPIVYNFALPDHAKSRIQVFLNPESDARGAGYNIIQSKLAIGAGKLFGMGVLKGNQTQLGFLYPKTTDFIFSVISEEMGFIIAGLVIIIYVVLITKAIYIAKTAKDDLGSYIAIGIAGIFIFHMIENIGMTMGLLPITGIPLPFVSYGGSSLITNFILLALLMNISGRRQKTIFMS